MGYGFMCCINYGEVMNKKDYEEIEKLCAIEPKRDYSKWFFGIFYMQSQPTPHWYTQIKENRQEGFSSAFACAVV